MTTKLRFLVAQDLFIDNEVYCLRRQAGEPNIQLAGMAWIMTDETVAAAHREALMHATSLVLSKLAGYSLWLLVGDTCWRDKSRITHYRKLWGALKARHIAIPAGRDMGECYVETDKGIRYFGALQLDLGSLDATMALLKAEPISHLVALSPEHSSVVEELIRRGWDYPGSAPSTEVLKAICSSEGVVFWPVGGFDDREVGAIALGIPEVLHRIFVPS